MEDWNDGTGATYVNLLIKTVQSISAKMYILCIKILQGEDTASGTVPHKRSCQTCC